MMLTGKISEAVSHVVGASGAVENIATTVGQSAMETADHARRVLANANETTFQAREVLDVWKVAGTLVGLVAVVVLARQANGLVREILAGAGDL